MEIKINHVSDGAAAGTSYVSIVRFDGNVIGNILKVSYNFGWETRNFIVESFTNGYNKKLVKTIQEAIACIFNITKEDPSYEVILEWAEAKLKDTDYWD